LLCIVNKVKLLGTEFKDSRIVEINLVTLPERYEACITTLENTQDLTKITLTELLISLQAHKQRRLMMQDVIIEGALTTSYKTHSRGKNLKNYSPYEHCGKNGSSTIQILEKSRREV